MKTVFRICYLFCLPAFATPAEAQLPVSKYEVGINFGTLIYQGDLTPSALGSFKTPGWALGLNGSRRLSNAFSVRADLNFGKLRGDDAKYNRPDYRQYRAFNFKSSVTELTGMLVWNAFGTHHLFSPYLFAGAGVAFLNIRRDYSNFNADYFYNEPEVSTGLDADAAHRLPGTLLIVPAGVGVRYTLTPNIALSTEAAYRFSSTDYLDGFSQSANPSKNDHYYKYSIGMQYTFGNKNRLDCPVVRY